MRTILQLACALALAVWFTPQVQAQVSYQLKAKAPGIEPPCFGFEFNALTATQTASDLILRVGVYNDFMTDTNGKAPIKASDITLTAMINGKTLQASPTTITLTDVFPSGRFAAKSMNSGLFTFPWGHKELPVENLDVLELHVPAFAPIKFKCSKDAVFTPPVWAEMAKLSQLNMEVPPAAAGLANIPMRIHSITLKGGEMEFTVSFRNNNRFPIQGSIVNTNGRQAAVRTGMGERLLPSDVSDSLKGTIAPISKYWVSGEDHLGWIRFPLPHPEAAMEMIFTLPGWEVANIVYDPTSHAWRAFEKPKPPATDPAVLRELIAKEGTMPSLRRLWMQMSAELGEHRWDDYLKHFRGKALEDQRTALNYWKRLPALHPEFSLRRNRLPTPDSKGRMRSVPVNLRYAVKGLENDHVFQDTMELDMQRDADGEWHIDFVNYTARQPFWTRGYVSMVSSEHFIVFYKGGEDNQALALQSAQQFDKSWVVLHLTQLPIKPTYPAFVVGEKDDFDLMAGTDPNTAGGVAIRTHIIENGHFRTLNQAIMINESNYLRLHRDWGKLQREIALMHELIHVVVSDMDSPYSPSWLVEGLATLYASQLDEHALESLRRNLTPAISLMELTKLNGLRSTTTDLTEIRTRYFYGAAAVRLLRERYGEKGLLAFYSSFADNVAPEWLAVGDDDPSSATACLHITQRLMKEHFGNLTLEALDSLVRNALKR